MESRLSTPKRRRPGPPAVSFLLSNEQGIQSLVEVLSPTTDLLYSQDEVRGPIFFRMEAPWPRQPWMSVSFWKSVE